MANDEPQTSGEDKNNRNGISFIFLYPKLKKKITDFQAKRE